MPLIQELPNATTTATPGWALVIDTGYDPSKEAIVPSGSRKQRAARNAQPGQSAALNSKHIAKVQRYVEDLKKDTPKDLQIVVPGKSKDATARGLKEKSTSGVRKILQSQKTFTNHLNDEEAFLANKAPEVPQQVTSAIQRYANSKTSKTTPSGKRRASTIRHGRAQESLSTDGDVAMEDSPATNTAASGNPPNSDDDNLFFRSEMPGIPSGEELEELLAAPALPYSTAAAAASQASAPPRQFCEICGHWGYMRCLRCSSRVCGLVCKLRHGETQCYAF